MPFFPNPGGYVKTVAKASSYTITLADAGTLFSDLGSTAQVIFTLPSNPPNGFCVGFVTTFTGGTGRIKVNCAGTDKMYWSNSSAACTTTVCNGSHSGIGQSIGLIYLSSSNPGSGVNGWQSIYGYIYDWGFS